MIATNSQTLSDFVLNFSTVTTSGVVSGTTTAGVSYTVKGIGGLERSDRASSIAYSETASEAVSSAEVYSALGVLGRPMPPEKMVDGGRSIATHAEVVCVKTADSLVPIAVRDVRLRMGGNAPGEGTIALVGYGGAFHSLDVGEDSGGSRVSSHVLYCPYDFDASGVARKAHAITLDPTKGNESISIVHAEGMAITIGDAGGKNEMVLKNKDGSAAIILDDDGITLTGQINLAGPVVLGNPLTAVPMLQGVASPPCSTLFVSP
jgi:hypothetical protein